MVDPPHRGDRLTEHTRRHVSWQPGAGAFPSHPSSPTRATAHRHEDTQFYSARWSVSPIDVGTDHPPRVLRRLPTSRPASRITCSVRSDGGACQSTNCSADGRTFAGERRQYRSGCAQGTGRMGSAGRRPCVRAGIRVRPRLVNPSSHRSAFQTDLS